MRVFSWYSLGMNGPRMWQTYMNWFSVLTKGFQCSLKSLAKNKIDKQATKALNKTNIMIWLLLILLLLLLLSVLMLLLLLCIKPDKHPSLTGSTDSVVRCSSGRQKSGKEPGGDCISFRPRSDALGRSWGRWRSYIEAVESGLFRLSGRLPPDHSERTNSSPVREFYES